MSRRLSVVLLVAVLSAACDSTPSDPLDPRTDVTALLDGSPAAGSIPGLSLPGLVYSAVHKVYSEQGASAARALVTDLRRMEEQGREALTGAGQEPSVGRLGSIRREEMRIVLQVFGDAIVPRIIDAVVLEAVRVEQQVDDAEVAGMRLPRARELLAQVDGQLAEATAALAGRDALAGLDAATRAGASAEAARHVLAGARRINGLEELFERAAVQLQTERGAVESRAALAEYNSLQRAAESVVQNGDRSRAHDALRAVRSEQIRLVLDVLGPAAVRQLVVEVAEGAGQVDQGIGAARQAGRDVARLERMSAVSREMLQRAQAALDSNDVGLALDLGSHAAGLVNAARSALTF
jgi:hypothetical protein